MNLVNLFKLNLTSDKFEFNESDKEYKEISRSISLLSVLSKQSLLDKLKSIHNKSSDPYFYIASYDPGVGKSTTLLSYIKAWKDTGFTPDEGALIILPNLSEIEDSLHSPVYQILIMLYYAVITGFLNSDSLIEKLMRQGFFLQPMK
ncbi:hypothetical protein U5A82_13935 [Sphingobium sp. CR2-8]|uniref:hypothetical protein n=1 Tax=Sphingobium sp. CR2-8 TaxID=1306534 RepID=UPI002DB90191|nr:hypothetical protein [Sphingobium sp. CR2-8]MEC3911522.1 hypothetical protein [Sphingobium sp. CR2-8]